MSLLLDALRRAEEAKRAKQGPGSNGELPLGGTPQAPVPELPPKSASDSAALALEPAAPTRNPAPERNQAPAPAAPPVLPAASGPKAGGLDFSLAELETPAALPSLAPAKSAAETPTPRTNPLLAKAPPDSAGPAVVKDDRIKRDQIRNAFAAKGTSSASASRKWLPALLAVVLVAIGGGGWYVWNEIQRMSRPAVAQAVRPPPAPAPALPAPSASTGSTGSATPGAPGATADTKTEPALPPLLPPELPKLAVVAPVAVGPAERPLTETERLAKSIKAAAPKVEPPLTLKPSNGQPARISPGVATAYAALQAGDFKRAIGEYERALAAEPLNLDAHLGLATAAAKSGDRATALRHYGQALDIDPKNTYALGGLVALRGESSLDRQEAGLRTLIAQHVDSPALQFALGNLMASQRRWQEAQQAYFDAWRAEPERADFAYNLAISLDQLNQPKLAREYYVKAIALAKSGGAQFDREAAARRVAELGAAPQ